MTIGNITDRMMQLSHIHHRAPNRDCPICFQDGGPDLSENNRLWWENQVRTLERSVMAEEQASDYFLARAERHALRDAKKQFAASICNG